MIQMLIVNMTVMKKYFIEYIYIMDNYFIYTLFVGIFFTYVILPPPSVLYKYNDDKCYKLMNEEVACKK